MRRRALSSALALATLVALAGVAEGAQRAVSISTLAVSTVVPLTIAPGAQGATALGTNATKATTIVSQGASPVAYTSLLALASATTGSQSVTLRLASATPLNRVDAASIGFGGVPQISIVAGIVTQSSGAATSVPASGTLTVSGTLDKANAGVRITLVVEVVAKPTAASGARVVETWTLELQ